MQTPASLKTFITAGKAIFTVVSLRSGARFTYCVRASKPRRQGEQIVHFVSVLTGPDNTADYTFIGTVKTDGLYVHSHKSTIAKDAPSVLAFRWTWEHIRIGNPVPMTDVHHEGRCGRCGRPLTVPESIQSGLGPECAGRTPGASAERSARRKSTRKLIAPVPMLPEQVGDQAA